MSQDSSKDQKTPRSEATAPLTSGIVREISDPTARRFRVSEERVDAGSSVFDAVDRSRKILNAARADAEKLLRDAKQIAEDEIRKSRARGLEEGRLQIATELLKISSLKDELLATTKQEILELAVSVAEEVVNAALQEQPESILNRIDRALAETYNARSLVIAVNPIDANYVRENLTALSHHFPANLAVAIREDNSLSPGDARLETDISVIEARVSTHLAAIKAHLRGNLPQHSTVVDDEEFS